MNGANNRSPELKPGRMQGINLAETRIADAVKGTNSGQASRTSFNRRNRRPQYPEQQDGGGVQLENSDPNTQLVLMETNELSDVDGDDGVSDLEEDGEIKEAGDGVEEKPQPLSAKMKKKVKRMGALLAKDAGPAMLTLGCDDLVPVNSEVTWDRDPELLCCYNWNDNVGTNTIFVPGCPPKWKPSALPRSLEMDNGFQYMDYNYVRKPREPYSPLFHALSVMNPDYQFWDVDLLADRNNLRILLEFAQGKANGPFCLHVHMVHNTLMLVRKGERFWTHQQESNRNFGSNFEKVFTTPGEGMESATSHYRAIRYPMGPLSVVVRFEADAYYNEVATDELNSDEADAVTGALLAKMPQFNQRTPIDVLQKGHIVPASQMAELKTQSYKPGVFPNKVACQDQLWFGRTRHLLTGQCQSEPDSQSGEVVKVKYEDAKERVDAWEKANQESLRKLVDLITRIKTVISNQPGSIRAGVLVREDKSGPLVVRTMLRKYHIIERDFFNKHWECQSRGGFHAGGRGGYAQAGMRGGRPGDTPHPNSHFHPGRYTGPGSRPYRGGYRGGYRGADREHNYPQGPAGFVGQNIQDHSSTQRGGPHFQGRGRGRGRGRGHRVLGQ